MVRRILHGFAKFIGVIVLLLILIIIGFFGVNQFDETLNPEFEAFMKSPTPAIPDEENGFIALQGLAAPAEENNFDFGKKLLNPKDKNHSDLLEKQIKFSGSTSTLRCWNRVPNNTSDACATEAELTKLIADNQILLNRLVSLYRFPHFAAQGTAIHGGSELISAQQLLMAKLVLDARKGNTEQALGAWIDNMHFSQRLLAGKSSIVSQAIYLVVRGLAISTYPMIAEHATPSQLAQNKAALDPLFTAPTFGKGGWDITETMRTEYAIIASIDPIANGEEAPPREFNDQGEIDDSMVRMFLSLPYKPKATRNLFYSYTKDIVALSQMSAPDLILNKPLLSKYNVAGGRSLLGMFANLYYNPVGKMVISGTAAGSDLMIAAHYKTAELRLLKLYTDARIAGIERKDMAAYVANAPEELQNPFTQKPFEWVVEKHALRLTSADKKQMTEVVY